MVSIIVSCIGEDWAYYIVGSVIEVVLLLGIAVTAWRLAATSRRRTTRVTAT